MVQNPRYAMEKLQVVDNIIQRTGRFAPVFVVDRKDVFDKDRELKFQKERHRWLVWAINNGEGCVRERIRRLRLKIPDEYKGYDYLPKIDMPDDVVETYFFIEDMEIALGIHPAINGRK